MNAATPLGAWGRFGIPHYGLPLPGTTSHGVSISRASGLPLSDCVDIRNKKATVDLNIDNGMPMVLISLPLTAVRRRACV